MKLIGCRALALPALFLGSPAIFPRRWAPCTSQKRARCLLRCGILARVSRSQPIAKIELQPGQKRRKRPAQYGTLGDAVEGEVGLFHVRWEGGSRMVGNVSRCGEDDAPLGRRRASQRITFTSVSGTCAVSTGSGCCTGGG